MFSQKTVIVDLAVDGEDDAPIGVGERLSSALCNCVSKSKLPQHFRFGVWLVHTNADNAESFVTKNWRT